MTQTSMNFSAPRPSELFRYGSQPYRIYEGLLCGGITSVQIQKLGCLSHTRRISDIREKLRPYLIDVRAEKEQGQIYIYKLTGGKA